VYSHELERLHRDFEVSGIRPGSIEPGVPGPGVADPDGYCLMVTDAAALELPTLSE
jgi:hypothetical protein